MLNVRPVCTTLCIYCTLAVVVSYIYVYASLNNDALTMVLSADSMVFVFHKLLFFESKKAKRLHPSCRYARRVDHIYMHDKTNYNHACTCT